MKRIYRQTEGYMHLQAATGLDTEVRFEVLPTSKVGCRKLTEWISRIAQTRESVVVMYDRGRIAKLIPVPKSLEEAVWMLKSEPVGRDRALRTDVRNRLLDGEVIGVGAGRKRTGVCHTDAFLVPYPHTAVLAERLGEKVWEVVERGLHR